MFEELMGHPVRVVLWLVVAISPVPLLFLGDLVGRRRDPKRTRLL
jgi:hypothetical protein